MAKIDLKKQFSDLYKASAGQPALVDVPPMKFLMVDGAGDPRRLPPEKWKTILRQPVSRS